VLQKNAFEITSYCTGFEILEPGQGLAILAAALHPASAFPPAAAASPLLWGALLKPGSARAGGRLYLEFDPPPPQPQAPAAQQHAPQQTASGGGSGVAQHVEGSSSGSRKQWDAGVRGQLLALVRGVVGTDVAPDQPLMEVGFL